MIQRCYNKNNPYYKNYGAKGITVCDKWKTFEGFLDDFDKIKGFSEEIFNSKKIFLDKTKQFKNFPKQSNGQELDLEILTNLKQFSFLWALLAVEKLNWHALFQKS